MADLKMPEINNVVLSGNLTKDPVFRSTSNNTPVVNFHIAANRRYKDSGNQWQEDVCYVGIVAWNKLAESCKNKLQKGNAVLIDGELQSKTFKTEDGRSRTIVEIKAKRIQFLNKVNRTNPATEVHKVEDKKSNNKTTKSNSTDEQFEMNSFDRFLTDEETNLINDKE